MCGSALPELLPAAAAPPAGGSDPLRNVSGSDPPVDMSERHLPPTPLPPLLLLLLLPSLLLCSGLEASSSTSTGNGGFSEPPGAELSGPDSEPWRPVPTAGKHRGEEEQRGRRWEGGLFVWGRGDE